MSSKARTLAKGSTLRICEFFGNAIVGVCLMPFIIHSLGDRTYGLWIVIGSFLGFYGLFDFGLVSAIQRYISRATGEANYKESNKVINTSLLLFSLIGLFVLLVTIVIITLASIFIKNPSEINLFRQIMIISGLSVAIGFPMRVFSSVLISHLRYDIYTTIELIKLFIRTILVVAFLKAGHGILALALITFGIELSGYIVKFFLVKKMFRYIVLSKALIDNKKIKTLFKYSSFTFISTIADKVRFNISNFVILGFLGLSFVTVYSIAARLIKYFEQFIMSTVGLTMPVFSQYEARDDYASIREKFVFITKISSYLSILIGGTLILFGQAFIKRWVGEEYLASYPLLIVLLVPAIVTLMQSPSGQLLYGISKHKFYAAINSIEVSTSLILSLILVRKLELMGVALGNAIPMVIIRLFVQPVYTCRVIKLDIRKYYLDLMAPILLKSLTIFAIFWWMCNSFIVPNYLNLLTVISCEFIMFLTIIFFIGLSGIERSYFKKAIFG